MTRLNVFVWSVVLIQISYVIWCNYTDRIGAVYSIPSWCCTLLVLSSGISCILSKKLRKFWSKEIF
jgi:uncharacterized membrane protein YwaF